MREKLSLSLEQRKYKVLGIVLCCLVVGIILFCIVFFGNKKSQNQKGADGNGASVSYEEAYRVLSELKTTKYEQLSIAEFDKAVEDAFTNQTFSLEDALNVVKQSIKTDDEYYDFIVHTLTVTASELDGEVKKPFEIFKHEVTYLSLTGEENKLSVSSKVYYKSDDNTKVTIETRDELLEILRVKIENMMNQLLLASMTKEEIKDALEDALTECCENNNKSNITLGVTFTDVSILE